MCSIKFVPLYLSVHWEREKKSLSPPLLCLRSKTLLAKQSSDSRLPVWNPGADWAFSRRAHASRMFFPSWSDTDWHLRCCLLSQAFSWGLWVDWDQRLKWWWVFICYNYEAVYPSHPFIGTGDALITAENVISISFPLLTTCLQWLCSFWPIQGTGMVSWPRGWNGSWFTSQARPGALRRHGPVT